MTHPSKVKGNRFEREIVNKAKEEGLKARRAYASDGRSLGLSEKVDCEVEGFRIQAKRRKRIAQWLKPDSVEVDLVAVREDRGDTFVVFPLLLALQLIKAFRKWEECLKE